jgi:uncharacterized protein YebE (UPF0316 family)
MIFAIIYIVISQFAFVFFRTLNVKYTAQDQVLGAMFTGLMINILWITTTAFGIEAYQNHNYVFAAAYLFGGQVGVYYGMRKVQIEKLLKRFIKWVANLHL